MSKDTFHAAVKNALIKEGWQITHDPFPIVYGNVNMLIDLGAETLIAAENSQEKIAVEIKSFLPQASAISEFHTALGQYINYRRALSVKEAERNLYLAVPIIAYNTFFQLEFPKLMIEENSVKLIIYDPEEEALVQWKN
ncbi:MAG: XisH family protein [Hormoscilla sp. GUM202]|nr:XisH family protein [Hormoscilla sp. GUM202]